MRCCFLFRGTGRRGHAVFSLFAFTCTSHKVSYTGQPNNGQRDRNEVCVTCVTCVICNTCNRAVMANGSCGCLRPDRVQLWRICAVFFCFLACSLQSITQKSIEHRIGCNCGAFAPYFFVFLACSLQSITQKSIGHRIGRNCGAFAPYFFQASLPPVSVLPDRVLANPRATASHS